VLTARYHTALGEILIDSAFDLIATIVFPMLTLLHADMACDIDYESFRIYNEVLPPGSFERRARMMADPNETARFKASVDALRILSASDLILRIGMHLFFSYRFNRVVEELVRQRTPRERLSTMEMQANQRHVPKAASLVFAIFGVGVVAVVSTGVARSRMACAPYPQCVVYAHWSDSSGLCPCLTLIDVATAPRSFDEWMRPPNVTDSVRALATAGKLRVLQLVNRNLPILPEELRRCEALELLYVCVWLTIHRLWTTAGFHCSPDCWTTVIVRLRTQAWTRFQHGSSCSSAWSICKTAQSHVLQICYPGH